LTTAVGGEQSIKEACRSGGVESESLLAAVRETMVSATPGTQDWKTESLAALIADIVSVHREYLKLELPSTQKRLDLVYAAHRVGMPPRSLLCRRYFS